VRGEQGIEAEWRFRYQVIEPGGFHLATSQSNVLQQNSSGAPPHLRRFLKPGRFREICSPQV
jgi:hypothetical protein